jgi:hypothetical protein
MPYGQPIFPYKENATDQMSIKKIAVPVTKYALSYPKVFREIG